MDSARILQQNQKQDIQKMLTEQYVPKGQYETLVNTQESLLKKHDNIVEYIKRHLPHLDPDQLDQSIPSYSQA